jgi:uncharacterized membrane protein YccC
MSAAVAAATTGRAGGPPARQSLASVRVSASESRFRTIARSLRRLYLDAAHLDLSQSDPIVAARNSAGLALPLIVAAALGNPAAGVAAGLGALQTAFADRPGPYRLRLVRMLLTAGTAATTAGLAAGLGHSVWASALLLALLGFVAGLLLTAGPSATQVGVAATACALVLGHIPESPGRAAQTGLLVLAGGAVQTVLAIAAWPLGRHRPERQALAALYRQLAGLAAHPIDTRTSPPLGPAIDHASAVLRGAGHDHGPSVEAYRVLLDEAVRARQDILVLSGYAGRLQAAQPEQAAAVRAELAQAALLLDAIADMLESGGQADSGQLSALLEPIEKSLPVLDDSLTGRAAVSRVRGLAGQLRAMVETARTGAGEGRVDEDAGRGSGAIRLRDPMAVLRANLNPGSPALRHAVRLAILVPLSDIATRAIGIERGYWVALTILVVLRPDFAATFQRSLMRVAGTLIGLLLASALVHYVLGDSTPALIALLTLSFFGMRLAGPMNMWLSSVFLAALVVVLLALAGVPAHSTVVVRAVDTAVGGGIALLAALLWPSWERRNVPERLGDLLGAYRDYLVSMVGPETTGAERGAARSRARLARSAAQASVDQAMAEPVDAQAVVELGTAMLAHSHRLVHALTAIDATRQAREVYAKVPEFRRLIDAALSTLGLLDQAVRHHWRQVRDLKLRDLQTELGPALAAAGLSQELRAALIEASDRMVNSLDSLAAVLAGRDRERVG